MQSNTNRWFQRLYAGNQNIVCQALIALSQLLNSATEQTWQAVVATDLSLASIFVSPLYNSDEAYFGNSGSVFLNDYYANQTNV